MLIEKIIVLSIVIFIIIVRLFAGRKIFLIFSFIMLLLIKINGLDQKTLPIDDNIHIDRIKVYKEARLLELISVNKSIKTYKIALGFNPKGHKIQENDGKTPEGIYYIERKKSDSAFHKALKISYPNDNDRADAKLLNVKPGGDIMIHEIRNYTGVIGRLFHGFKDWTKGCIAVTNKEIDEIYSYVKIGTIVEIIP